MPAMLASARGSSLPPVGTGAVGAGQMATPPPFREHAQSSSDDAPNPPCSTGSSKLFGRVRAGGSSAAPRTGRGEDGADGRPGRASVGLPCGARRGSPIGDGARLRRGCTSCWRRCWIVSNVFLLPSSTRYGSRSVSVPGRHRALSHRLGRRSARPRRSSRVVV